LGQCGAEVIRNLLRQHVRLRKIVQVFEAFVAQLEEVEADLFAAKDRPHRGR
jgi:flagellar biosynthesis component FlhA